jgi:hypothetical protein|tara:strand:- start:4854 stop:5084 length:231 start_codon:yes stop_codon:yes gene_type:complete
MYKKFSAMNITQEAEQMTQRQELTIEDKVRMFDRWCKLVSDFKYGSISTDEYTERMKNLLRDCDNYGFIKEELSKV